MGKKAFFHFVSPKFSRQHLNVTFLKKKKSSLGSIWEIGWSICILYLVPHLLQYYFLYLRITSAPLKLVKMFFVWVWTQLPQLISIWIRCMPFRIKGIKCLSPQHFQIMSSLWRLICLTRQCATKIPERALEQFWLINHFDRCPGVAKRCKRNQF